MSINALTQFFGWCSIVNIGVLIVSTMIVVLFRKPISHIHSGIMGIQESGLPRLYFQYLAFYKVSIFVFSLVPYIALKIMA